MGCFRPVKWVVRTGRLKKGPDLVGCAHLEYFLVLASYSGRQEPSTKNDSGSEGDALYDLRSDRPI